MSLRKLLALSTAPVLLILLLSCDTPSNGKNRYDPNTIPHVEADGGTFIIPSIGDASILNPLLASDSASGDINGLVYNGLIKYDKDIKLVGDLAESFKIEEDGLKITFYLRENVKWHDGKPFTADDVYFTYKSLIAPETRTPYSADFMMVKSARVLNSHTFQVTYDQPFAPGLESWGMGIIPKHIFEGSDINENPANRSPIGTGPYIFKEWKSDEKIVLTANEDYFEGRPHFDRYIYRIIPDLSVQFLELRQGSLSLMTPTPDQYNGYEQFFNLYNKYRYPAFRYDYVGFNLNRDLFKNKKVRQALAHAVNKKDIIEGVYQGYAVPSTGPYPPLSWAYNPEVPDRQYDPALTKNLLAEEGWQDSDGDGILDKDGKPFTFTLLTNQGNKVRESIAQVIQNSLSQVGVKMDIRVLEWSVFIHKYVDKREFDAVLLGWNLGRDPDAYPIWHSSQTGENQYNFVSYKNKTVDRLLERGRTTFNLKTRKSIYQQIHAIIADDTPYIFLVTGESLPVVHKKILNVKLEPLGLTWDFINWYIPKAWQDKPRMAS